MKVLALIPARMGSSRFPGKPMAPPEDLRRVEQLMRALPPL